MAAGYGKKSPPGSGDASTLDICVQETGDSGGVGGPTDDLRFFCNIWVMRER